MTLALRDRQSALAVAILFLIVSINASIAHRITPPGLADMAAGANPASASLCMASDPDGAPDTPSSCDACRLVEAPGLTDAAPAALELPICIRTATPLVARTQGRASDHRRSAMPRAPPAAIA